MARRTSNPVNLVWEKNATPTRLATENTKLKSKYSDDYPHPTNQKPSFYSYNFLKRKVEVKWRTSKSVNLVKNIRKQKKSKYLNDYPHPINQKTPTHANQTHDYPADTLFEYQINNVDTP